jgi:hypothetical protein
MSNDSLEAPEADAAEQEADALPEADEESEETGEMPLEADPADAVEQARVVPPEDDEDYR